ncbi:hypothetical protein ABIG06_006715 [Bradyrhizobium sp. USDA 326]|uniref:hypothetical protein n=1 Tax=unclassified Bradyrhizobium TaxID=2631580 RepID=UPI003518F1C1
MVQRKASGRSGGERVDIREHSIPGPRDFGRPFMVKQIAERIPDDGEERDEQLRGAP